MKPRCTAQQQCPPAACQQRPAAHQEAAPAGLLHRRPQVLVCGALPALAGHLVHCLQPGCSREGPGQAWRVVFSCSPRARAGADAVQRRRGLRIWAGGQAVPVQWSGMAAADWLWQGAQRRAFQEVYARHAAGGWTRAVGGEGCVLLARLHLTKHVQQRGELGGQGLAHQRVAPSRTGRAQRRSRRRALPFSRASCLGCALLLAAGRQRLRSNGWRGEGRAGCNTRCPEVGCATTACNAGRQQGRAQTLRWMGGRRVGQQQEDASAPYRASTLCPPDLVTRALPSLAVETGACSAGELQAGLPVDWRLRDPSSDLLRLNLLAVSPAAASTAAAARFRVATMSRSNSYDGLQDANGER